ncbi:MAG: magnesium transporter [Phycisphaerales bacterium]
MSDSADVVRTPPLTALDFALLIGAGERAPVMSALEALEGPEQVLVVSRLSDDDRAKLLELVGPEQAAPLLEHLPEPQVFETIEILDPEVAAQILQELPSDRQADVIGELEAADAEAILESFDDEDAADVRRLAEYEDDEAGGLMVTEYLEYPAEASVAEVIEDLGLNAERYADYDIQYAYVVDDRERLVGVLRMRDLLLSARSIALREVMIPSPLTVGDHDSIDDLVSFFDEYKFFGAPVVDDGGVLRGVVQRSHVEAAVAEGREGEYRRAQGIVGGEELRTMPLLTRSRRRLSWLSVNIVLNIIAASVIALHQDTLEAVIALAVFLPIISDMSGCSGNQAVAVSMRELTLGVIRPTEVVRTVIAEALLGLINGLVLGLLIGLVAFFWKGNGYLGLVVGGALMLNTIVAVCIGGSVPLLLKRMKVDPALAAGPILTTITDMCGFFIVLSFASLMLERLV